MLPLELVIIGDYWFLDTFDPYPSLLLTFYSEVLFRWVADW